jgi:aspartate carbamoyltransferase catalytic subunit
MTKATARPRHIISVREINCSLIEAVFGRADMLHNARNDTLKGKSLCCVAAQPSTRTLMSFKAAISQLGGAHDTLPDPQHSSEFKGESFRDTVRVLAMYHDVLVVRHHDTQFPREAAQHSSVPVINAGNGPDEHPTQFLLDAYAIRKKSGRLENHTIVVCGDLQNGRAPRSLLLGFATHYPLNEFILVPGEGMDLKDDVEHYLRSKNITFRIEERLEEAIEDATVVYMTRWQKEYSDKHAWNYPTLTPKIAALAKKQALFMHPLPANRDRELPYEIDELPQAIYFKEQLWAGLTIRKALLQELLL